jgi:DNA-binding transcriptional regulator YbjK
MRGLDLSRTYYNEIIKPLINDNLPKISNDHAAALIGWGSDVLGNDDELSGCFD